MWDVRESGLGATAFIPLKPDAWPGLGRLWRSHRKNSGEYLRKFDTLMQKKTRLHRRALRPTLAWAVCNCRIDLTNLTTHDGVEKYRAFAHDAADLVVSLGGSLSGEHGDGQARGELLPKMFGDKIVEAFREFKAIWDPSGKMNPGKVVNPLGGHAYRIDENLRLGEHYRPKQVETHFAFSEDAGNFARAALRCVGVGNGATP